MYEGLDVPKVVLPSSVGIDSVRVSLTTLKVNSTGYEVERCSM